MFFELEALVGFADDGLELGDVVGGGEEAGVELGGGGISVGKL